MVISFARLGWNILVGMIGPRTMEKLAFWGFRVRLFVPRIDVVPTSNDILIGTLFNSFAKLIRLGVQMVSEIGNLVDSFLI